MGVEAFKATDVRTTTLERQLARKNQKLEKENEKLETQLRLALAGKLTVKEKDDKKIVIVEAEKEKENESKGIFAKTGNFLSDLF